MLSQVEKLILCKSVLPSIPFFHLATTKFLSKDLDRINNIISRFWWGNNEGKSTIHLIAWESITRPLREGGLGLRNLKFLNESLLASKFRK